MNFFGSVRRSCALCVAFVVLPHLSFGALTWKTQQIDLTAKSSDKEAVGIFHFVNSGRTTVTILSVTPDCGCTAAELAKQTYAPGEAGEIKTVFKFEDRTGSQRKTIQVLTDDEPTKPLQLVLQVDILERMTCLPRLLLWSVGGEKSAKSAVISVSGANWISAVEIKTVTPAEVAPTARIETVEAGKKYRLVVQPASLAKAAQTTISCVASFADGTTQSFSVFALVR